MSRSEVKLVMREILEEIAKEKGWISLGNGGDDEDQDREGKKRIVHNNDEEGGNDTLKNEGTKTDLTMVFETVTARGIEVELLPL